MGRTGIQLAVGSQISIANVTISEMQSYGINVDQCLGDISVSNVTISGSYRAFQINDICSNVYMVNLYISDTHYGINIYNDPPATDFFLSRSVVTSRYRALTFDYYEYVNDLFSSIWIEDTEFYSQYYDQYNQAIYFDEYLRGYNNQVNLTVTGCTFQNFQTAFEYSHGQSSSYYYYFITHETFINICNCTFVENRYAIRARISNFGHTSLTLQGNILEHQTYAGLDIITASYNTDLLVTNNAFHSNEGTVLRIPNTIRFCTVVNNTFWNNTASHVVHVFELFPINSAISDTLTHVFQENIFGDNRPGTSFRYFRRQDILQCVLLIRAHNTVVQNNIFNNTDFPFELCLGAYPYFNIDESVDARFNWWNTADTDQIAERIFDQNDWNDRPSLVVDPYVDCEGLCTSETQIIEASSLGGRITNDLTLSADAGPYLVDSDITVLPNVTLTIEAGTELRFEPAIGLLVLGRLVALGNPTRPIKFQGGSTYTDLAYNYGDIRLFGGPSESIGILQVYSYGVWGTLIYYDFYYDAAVVACRQLGLGELVDYYHLYETEFWEIERIGPIWYSYIYCDGDEQKLTDCYDFYLERCFCPFDRDYVVVLECSESNSTLSSHASSINYTNPWGGVRIIKEESSILDESILQYVDIIGAGQLHNDASPALYISGVSPVIDNITITNSSADGLVVDSPNSGFLLKDVRISQCESGIVLNNIDHVPVRLEQVTSTNNRQFGLKVVPEEQSALFSDNLFRVQPVCSDRDNEDITVAKSSDLLFQGRYTSCEIDLKPESDDTLTLEAFRLRRDTSYNYNCLYSVYIYDNSTGSQLGAMHCSDDYLRIVAPVGGGAIHVSVIPEDDYRYEYNDYYNYYYYDYFYYGYYYDDFYNNQDGFDEDLGRGLHLRVVSTISDGKSV